MTDSLSSIITVNESLSYTYDKNSLLGKGASSTVHKGTFKEEGVAVKRMKDELSDDDKKLLLNIKHENIVLVLCIENHLGLDHIVLELCLASFHQYFKEYEKVMNKFGGLTVVKKYMNQDAVKGLEYLHEQNIIHRDIKPGNILLVQKSSSSEVKAVLADFGLSTKLDDDQFSKTTLEGRGTLSWMAPELLREDGSKCKFSRQSDIFSMGCVIYFAETGGSHPFDKGDSHGAVIHQNVKKYDPCDFCLLNDKPKAMDLIKKMIKKDTAARPSAIEVLQDPYFKEDDSQETIVVHLPTPQLIKGGEAPEGDTPQDTSEALEEGHTSIPPEQCIPDTSYGEQLYDVMTKMSHSLPRYIIDHYIRLLMIVNVKSDMKPDWSLSKRFSELYSTHASKTSSQVAATYVYKILTGLGYEEMDEHDFRAYLHIELEIDTKITEELGKITEFRPTVIEVVRELDLKLGVYQKDRYRMVLTVLRAAVFDSNKSFFEYFTDLAQELGKYPLAVAFTIGVLERSGWGDTKKLKPFSLPEFDFNTAYPQVDLCLTVADYYGNMSERDFSSAKVYTSAVCLNNQNVSKMSRVQFTLLLMERGAVKINDVSKIEDKVRYPIFFKEYKERCNRPSKETAPTTETVPTQETVVAQETVAQATSSQSPSTPTDQAEQPPAAEKVQPSFLTRVKNFLFPSSNRQEQEVPGTTTQTNTTPAPTINGSTDTAPAPTINGSTDTAPAPTINGSTDTAPTPSIPESTDTAPAPTISSTSAAKEDVGEVPAPIPPTAAVVPIPPLELFPKLDDLQFDNDFSDDLVKDINILLMTATNVELRGVLGYLKPLGGQDKVIKLFIKSTWVYIGRYGNHIVVVGKSADDKDEQGGLDALTTAQEIMTKFKPNYVIAIGICFGMDRSKLYLGDVIVSRKIVDLSNFRKEPGNVKGRKFDIQVGLKLSKIFSDATHDFKKKHFDEENAKEVKVHPGPIVTSPVLVDDKQFKKELMSIRPQDPDLLAGEMEGAGIYSAARHDDCRPEVIVIKGVGDWGDGKDACRDWKDFASHTAAAYAHHQMNKVSVDALK